VEVLARVARKEEEEREEGDDDGVEEKGSWNMD